MPSRACPLGPLRPNAGIVAAELLVFFADMTASATREQPINARIKRIVNEKGGFVMANFSQAGYFRTRSGI